MTLRIERYTDREQPAWDSFVRSSRNGTFLFERGYMDYHRERFTDFSLMLYDHHRLVALLPAESSGNRLTSHGGLSYGGLVTGTGMTLPLMLRSFDALLTACQAQGFSELRYKATPPIFHRLPAQEDLYALYHCGANLIDRTALTVIGRTRPRWQTRRRRGVKRAQRAGLVVCETDALPQYWALLETTLQERQNTRPTHTDAEIALLRQRFPQNIRLYACFESRTMIAGVLIYETDMVARAQYIAANARGRALGALDLLFDFLINRVYANLPYFDFGTSHDPQSRALNTGLVDQKEGFGGRTITQDTYSIDLTAWVPGQLQRLLT